MIPPDASSTTRGEGSSITVVVPDSTAAESARLGSPPANPPRQGMDVVDHSIREFDARMPAPTGVAANDSRPDTSVASRRETSRSDAQANSAAWSKGARTRTEGTVSHDSGATASTASQTAGDDQADSRNRRLRQARGPASTVGSATREPTPQPLLFGRVSRASFALARMQTGTVTRGVRLVPASRTATLSMMRPGAISGRGIAQVADLGRGSATYGAAPEVFTSADEPPKSHAAACKPKSSARDIAKRQDKPARATACS